MKNNVNTANLIIPVYINEKIVLDMLAIMEDGFSMVSQINYTEHKETNSSQKLDAGISTSATILSKLLKINISGDFNHAGSSGEDEKISREKVHTNVSLLSKFRDYLISTKALKTDFDVSQIEIGDFIEAEGELQKNPLINYMDLFIDVLRMADIFNKEPSLGNRTQAKAQKQQESEMVKQIKSFADELKHSGTIDFILADDNGTVVLSAQEQYLANDNISEIIGGRFKVLGKVIAICKDKNESIEKKKKTTLSVLPEEMISKTFAGLYSEAKQQLILPEFKTKICGPAIIVIPVAIYA